MCCLYFKVICLYLVIVLGYGRTWTSRHLRALWPCANCSPVHRATHTVTDGDRCPRTHARSLPRASPADNKTFLNTGVGDCWAAALLVSRSRCPLHLSSTHLDKLRTTITGEMILTTISATITIPYIKQNIFANILIEHTQ